MSEIMIKITDLLNKAEKIVISGHVNPDGDCISACIATALTIKKLNKNPVIVLESFADKYNYLPGSEFIVNDYDGDIDLFIGLDCADADRLGCVCELFKRAGHTVNIDHHITNSYYADYNLVDKNASSTCELLYGILKTISDIDLDTAACLYSGILYDTGGFRHSNTSSQTYKIAGNLLEFGINTSAIYKEIFETHTFSEIKIVGEALQSANRISNGDCIYTTISKKQIENHGGTAKELDEIINWLINVRGARVAAFIYEKGCNEIKVSLRSNTDFDVSAFAQKFNGGGHVRAAGFSLAGTLEQAVNRVLPLLEHMMNCGGD